MSQYDLIIKMLCERFDRVENKLDQVDKKINKIQNKRIYSLGFGAGVLAVFSLLGFIIQLVIGR